MTDTKYNGWTNWETWNCNIHMDNDGSSDYWRERSEELLKEAFEDEDETPRDTAAAELAYEIECSIYDAMPEKCNSGLFADILNAALSRVNWDEIAERYIADLDDPEQEGE